MPLIADRRWVYWALVGAAAAAAGATALLLYTRAARGSVSAANRSSARSISAEFARGVAWARGPAGIRMLRNTSLADKLELYAYYKQAMIGEAPDVGPSAADFAGRAKWAAWRKASGMSVDRAAECYLARMDELVPSWRAEAARSDNMDIDNDPAGAVAEPSDDGADGSFGYTHTSRSAGTLLGAGEDDVAGDALTLASLCERDAGDEGTAVVALQALLRSRTPADARNFVRMSINGAGETALHLAADAGRAALVAELLAAGADPRATEPASGATALHYAVLSERAAVLRELLAADAAAARDVRDADGVAALDAGLASSNAAVVAACKEAAAVLEADAAGAARGSLGSGDGGWVHVPSDVPSDDARP